MKKYVSMFLCLAYVLTLVACGKMEDPITLPQTDENKNQFQSQNKIIEPKWGA